jgi:alcohol dehydrogenase class IV
VQKILQGLNSINQVPAEIAAAGYDAVFLITGKHLQEENLFNQLPVTHFIKSGPNVEEKEIEAAYNYFLKNSKQAIVAIGGGSVIDIAKAIIYRCIESSLPVPFFVAAPTTAGSGSEATHFAVVYKGNKKQSLIHPRLLPEVAVLDAKLSFSLPAYQTAVSGMDALAQAVESYWNVNATVESKRYAAESIGLWRQSFLSAVTNPDTAAREDMLWSAHLAGKAINITRTTGPHALSYYLTANHNIPHGQAVALFLQVFFLYNKPGADLCSLFGVANGSEAMEYIQDIMKQAGLSTSFAELGLNKKEILDDVLNEVNEERFANNPAAFDRDKLKQLISEYL